MLRSPRKDTLSMTSMSEALAVASHHHNMGEAYRTAGKLEDAIACYRQALALKPDYAEAHTNLGIALWDQRSEEHTSELQSRLHLVCRLLLEKKKKNRRTHETLANRNR